MPFVDQELVMEKGLVYSERWSLTPHMKNRSELRDQTLILMKSPKRQCKLPGLKKVPAPGHLYNPVVLNRYRRSI